MLFTGYICHFVGTHGAREALPWTNWSIGNLTKKKNLFTWSVTYRYYMKRCLIPSIIQYYKQTQLETMASEKAAAEFHLEKELKRLQEAQVCP